MHFIDMLEERIDRVNSRLVVGIDPYPERIFGENSLFAKVNAHLSSESLLREFCRTLLDVAESTACAVKPQAAFFESMGIPGVVALAECLREAQRKDIPVILDAKRGDIGNSAEAYAQAYLNPTSELSADAVTVNPYLGPDTLVPCANTAAKYGRGLFVLVKTSNPGSGEYQDAKLSESGEPLYIKVARAVTILGEKNLSKSGYSHVGAVVGATYPQQLSDLRGILSTSYLLIPGYGAQGGTAEDVRSAFMKGGRGAVVSASRSIDYAYEGLGESATKEAVQRAIFEAAKRAKEQVNEVANLASST